MKSPWIFLSLLILPCAVRAADAPASVTELFATPEILNVVRAPEKVEVCILRHIAAVTRADGSVDHSTERYEETAFTPVPAAIANSLRDLLLNGKTYDWKAGNGGRRPQFYLRLRYHRGGEIVAIDFCFMCHVLSITHKGREIGHANFSPNADLFLQAFLKLFPDDEPLKQVAKEAGVPL